jgi:DNA repair exonuclease SbcCD ATPase subunit
MSFFTIGNLLTLGIVVLILILYRQMDRNNRSLDKVRRYGVRLTEELKEELTGFVAGKESAVKDYITELGVELQSAKVLFERFQDQELAGKAEAVAKIDERLKAYDASLEELVRMTGRVQENMNRIRDESAFVENAARRVSEAKAKFEAIEKNLGELELRFERENAGSLEKTAEAVIAAVSSTVSDLAAAAETAERQVEDHREAIDQAEKARQANLARDAELINKTLKAAVEQASLRADKLEDAAVVKFREQALERLRRFQEAVEEKLRAYQESAKTRIAEVQGLVKTYKEEWRTEHAEIEAKQHAYKDEWKRDVQELNVLARSQRDEWKRVTAEADAGAREVLSALERAAGETRQHVSAETAAAETRLKEFSAHTDEVASALERRLEQTAEDAERRVLAEAESRLERWKLAGEEADAKGRQLLSALEAASGETRDRISAEMAALEQRFRGAKTHAEGVLAELDQRLIRHTEDEEQRVLEAADAKLEEYRAAQNRQYQQLETLAEDVKSLDAELRIAMGETENRVRRDFALFERESANNRERAASEYTASVEALKADLEGVEKELAALKERAYENVSEKLRIFEDDFTSDLAARGDEIDKRLGAWVDSLETRLTALGEAAEAARRNLELSFNETLKNRLAEQDQRLVSELEHLKAETGAFEEGIRDQMAASDQSLQSFREQLDRDLEEARSAAEASAKAEIGRYALAMAETLKRHQRDIESRLKGIADEAEDRSGEITGTLDGFRREIDEWQSRFAAQLRDTEAALDEAGGRTRELAAESDKRLASVRAAVEEVREAAAAQRAEIFSHTEDHAKSLDAAIKEADRHIKEFVNQTKLFDQADELRLRLERRIEDLRSDIDGLDQRRTEAADLEAKFVKIKRLEDEVNAKMTWFRSEKGRIELMEADFNRLLQTSKSVEEKLVQVSSEDDTLQAVQVKIRELDRALAETEEKYQRIERKNQALEATSNGIDRNFKSLQEAEAALKGFSGELFRLSGEQQSLAASIEELAANCEKARETSEKVSVLDDTLTAIEKRIEDMQVARKWLADIETRLEEINKTVQDQIKLMGGIFGKEEGGKVKDGSGAPPIRTREMVVQLAHKGWSTDEIAKSLKISKGAVELILELAPKG